MNQSDEFMIYHAPGEERGCFIKTIENPDAADAGVYMRRFKLFQGKDASGFAQKMLRDPAYVEIDAWTAKHNLPPLEFCPITWLENDLASFETGFELEGDDDSIERAYNRWAYIKTVKDERVRVKNKVVDKVHRMYSAAQAKYVDDAYQLINKNYIAKGFHAKKANGAASQEISRQEMANIYRGVLIAVAHCEANAPKTGKTLRDYRDAIFEREDFLLKRALRISGNPQEWDSVTEMIDMPPPIGSFFGDYTPRKFAQLSQPDIELFKNALQRVMAEEP